MCLTFYVIDVYSFAPMNFDLKEDLASDNSTVNDVAESKGVEIDLNAEPDFLAYVLSEGSVQSDI